MGKLELLEYQGVRVIQPYPAPQPINIFLLMIQLAIANERKQCLQFSVIDCIGICCPDAQCQETYHLIEKTDQGALPASHFLSSSHVMSSTS